MLSLLSGESAGVIAHSLSAVSALKLVGTERRVHKVMTTGTMSGAFKAQPLSGPDVEFPERPRCVAPHYPRVWLMTGPSLRRSF